MKKLKLYILNFLYFIKIALFILYIQIKSNIISINLI